MIRPFTRIRRRGALLSVVVLIAMLAVRPAPAFAQYDKLEGSGSTWSYVILQQWIADVSSSGMQVSFNNNGSSQGRKDFANYVTDFGISEIPYQGVDPVTKQADTSTRPYAYLPIVAGGTAFTYHVEVGGKLVTNLRLSGETLAKIFTNKITNWNDAQITRDNNGRALPSLPIHPVVRSDGSGTTAQFTRYLDTMYPSIWRPYNGQAGLTSQFPRKGTQIAASGSDQVMNTIKGPAGNGTIGYVEYSYPINANYPVVKVENAAGYFVQPTQFNVAVALTQAKINTDASSKDYLTQILDDVYRYQDRRTYPLSSYSYMLIPTSASDRRMTTGKRQTLADFLTYSLCAGQAKAGPYGYSPLPLNLVQAGFTQVAKLKAADPKVDLSSRDVTTCHNPTFVAGNLKANHLAQVAPMPQECDKVGAGPCGVAGAPRSGSTTGPQTTGGASAPPGTTTGAGTAPTGAPVPQSGSVPTASGVVADPAATVAAGTDGAASAAVASPYELSAVRTGDDRLFSAVAVLELLAVVLLPGLYVAWRRRRSAS